MTEKMPWDDVPAVQETTSAKMPWDDVPSEVPMDTPTAEELEKYSKPDPARANLKQDFKRVEDSQGFTADEAATIPLGDMDVEETIQFNREQAVADQYKDYQSGNIVVDKEGNSQVRKSTLGDDFEVTTDMYSKSSNPNRLYEMLLENSDGRDITGQKTYKGRIIPAPQNYSGGGLDTPGTITGLDLAADTGREMAKNTLVKAAATVDEIAYSLGYKTDLTTLAQNNIADPAKAEKVSHQVAKDIMRIAPSVAVGAKTGQKLSSATGQKNVNAWILSVASAFSLDALTADVSRPNTVIGNDAMIPLNEGFEADKATRPSEKVIRQTGDYFLDNLVTAGPAAAAVEGGIQAGKYGGRLVSSFIAPWFKGDLPIAKEEAQKFLSLAGVNTTEKLNKVIDDLRTKGEVTLEFPDGTLAPITLKRSSMSAIEEGAKETGDNVLANAAMEAEKSAHKQNMLGPSFDALKQQPVKTLSKVQKEAIDARGGVDAIEQTKNLLADSAIKKIDKSQNLVTTAKSQADDFLKSRQSEAAQQLQKKTTDAQLQVGVAEDIVAGSKKEQEEATAGLMELFQRDKDFATAIDDLSKSSGIDVGGRFRAKATDELLPDLVQGVSNMKNGKNSRYTTFARLAEGVPIDEKSFIDVLMKAKDAKALPADAERMITHELGDDIEQIENLSYRQIYNMLPKINEAIYKLRNSTDADAEIKISALEALRENINVKQLDEIIKYEDVGQELKDAAIEAKRYYMDEYIRFARDRQTPIGMLFDAFDNAYNERFARFNPDTGKLEDLGFNYLLKDKAQQVAEEGLSKKTGSSQQVADFAKHSDTGIDKGKFLGPYKGKVLDALHKVLEEHGGDFSKIKPYMVNKALEDEGVSLTKHFPEDTQKINDFIEEFKTKKGAVTQAEETVKKSEEALATTQKATDKFVEKAQKEHDQILDDSKKVAKDAVKKAEKKASSKEQEVWKSALGKFIEKSPDGTGKAIPVGSGYTALNKMLKSDGNVNKIKYIADQIKKSGDKDAQKGLEVAMLEHMKEVISDSNIYKVKGAQVSKLLSDSKDLKKYGKIIFGNSTNPEEAAKGLQTFDTFLKTVDFVNNEQLKSVSATGTFMDNKDNTIPEAKKAANYLIGVIWGRFNSTSLRLSGTAGRFIETTDPVTKRKNIISALHEHPDYLADILELVKEGTKAPASSELKRALILTGILTAKQQAQKDEKKMPEGIR